MTASVMASSTQPPPARTAGQDPLIMQYITEVNVEPFGDDSAGGIDNKIYTANALPEERNAHVPMLFGCKHLGLMSSCTLGGLHQFSSAKSTINPAAQCQCTPVPLTPKHLMLQLGWGISCRASSLSGDTNPQQWPAQGSQRRHSSPRLSAPLRPRCGTTLHRQNHHPRRPCLASDSTASPAGAARHKKWLDRAACETSCCRTYRRISQLMSSTGTLFVGIRLGYPFT